MQFHGKARTDFYFTKSDMSGIVKPTITSGVMTVSTTAATALTDVAFTTARSGNDFQVSSKFDIGDGNVITGTINGTYYNSTFTTFADCVAPLKAGSASSAKSVDELYDESGTYKSGGDTASSTGQLVTLINYGSAQADGKINVWLSVGTLKRGGIERKAGGNMAIDLTFTSTPITAAAGLSIAAALFDSAIVAVSTAQVIRKDYHAVELWLDPVA